MTPETDYLPSCLKDCGLEGALLEQYLKYAAENCLCGQLRLLNRQRRLLMDNLHTAQKKVDCLDFIIRELEAKKAEGTLKSNTNQQKGE